MMKVLVSHITICHGGGKQNIQELIELLYMIFYQVNMLFHDIFLYLCIRLLFPIHTRHIKSVKQGTPDRLYAQSACRHRARQV